MELEKVYEPQRFEPRWAEWWVEQQLFVAGKNRQAPVFSLVIPPPNVTGSLHMGHMLEHTEIDVTIRWYRMRGYDTLWLPGTDHAGIATQMVVERALAEEGLTRHQLGREKFEQRVWQWKEQYGGTIKRQMIRLGASCDWTRERFTLDPGLSRAVREVFVRLFEKGLIYRGEYMINWCPRCETALSDLEVVYDPTPSNLWYIRYPIRDGGGYVVVATTRPETMLGDTAVAVNPEDSRYRHLIGKTVILPLMNREIPVVADPIVDPEFGTGVVKITPAHDPNDFEAGKRHKLPSVKVIDEHARMTGEAGPYAGLDRFEARRRVIADLEQQGLLEKIEPYELPLSKCQRCKTPLEPMVSTQWFVRTKPLAEPAIQVVKDGRIRFIPENWTKTYFDWMYNIRDWCISRQLWWGHRIPAWHCTDCGGITVDRVDPTECHHCRSPRIEQDPDVLDTWFSSALWPFSTLGWPDQTDDLQRYYPTSLLITGFDILFFWVARMIMMGLECVGDVPFREVYIHGLVRDAEKQKMSKTKGNVIDPLDVTEKYGTDAVRMALLQGAAPGTDIVLTEERMAASRAFANKIWNAARFLFLRAQDSGFEPRLPEGGPDLDGAPLEDRWMFSRLNRVIEQANRAIAQYRYHELAQTLWQFFWHEFCDWYVELKKLRFTPASGWTRDWQNSLSAFETALRLLHPAMPFITEELWQRLAAGVSQRPMSIALAQYPQPQPTWEDPKAERDMELLQQIIVAARNLRAELRLDPKQHLQGTLYARDSAYEVAREHQEAIARLAGVTLEIYAGEPPELKPPVRSTPEFDLMLRVPGAQLEALKRRIHKEVDELERLVENSRRQLENPEFRKRAPEHVVQSLRERLAEYEAKLESSRAVLQNLP